jgi:hypothetical protein
MTQAKEGDALKAALEPFARLARPINGEADCLTYLEAIGGPNGTDELQLSTMVGDGWRIEILDAEDFRRADRVLQEALSRPTQPASGAEVREMCAKVADEAAARRIALFNENGSSLNASKAAEAEEIATAIRALPIPEAGAGEPAHKPWYEVDAHRDLSRIIPEIESKIAEAKKMFAHCLPANLFGPIEVSITELRVLRHEVAAPQAQQAVEAVAWMYERKMGDGMVPLRIVQAHRWGDYDRDVYSEYPIPHPNPAPKVEGQG